MKKQNWDVEPILQTETHANEDQLPDMEAI